MKRRSFMTRLLGGIAAAPVVAEVINRDVEGVEAWANGNEIVIAPKW